MSEMIYAGNMPVLALRGVDTAIEKGSFVVVLVRSTSMWAGPSLPWRWRRR